MPTVSDQAVINHIGARQSFIADQADMAREVAFPSATHIGDERPRPGSFYAVVIMAIASWLVVGAIGLAIYLAM